MYNLTDSGKYVVVGVMKSISYTNIYYDVTTGELVFEDEAAQGYFLISELAVANPKPLSNNDGMIALLENHPDAKGAILAEEGVYYIYADDTAELRDILDTVLKERFTIDTNIAADDFGDNDDTDDDDEQ